MDITFWGVRGSFPITGKEFNRYGGGTICIEVVSNSGQSILLDAGSGLYNFAINLKKRKIRKNPIIFLSHYHKDHIEGLPFFEQFYDVNQKLEIYGPLLHDAKNLNTCLSSIFNGIQFPVNWKEIPMHNLHGFNAGENFEIDNIKIETFATNHPGGCVAYKLYIDGVILSYTADHEISFGSDIEDDKIVKFIANSDIAIVDSTFNQEEHKSHIGWGHSNFSQWVNLTKYVKNLVFFHHAPEHDDIFLENELAQVKAICESNCNLYIASQNMVIDKNGIVKRDEIDKKCSICEFFKQISSYTDTHAVLGSILQKAREICSADAGTIYLEKEKELFFSSAQNDTLFPASKANRFFYLNSSIAIDKKSIAGYVACTGECLNIPDVYNLESVPFSFNKSFDEHSGYRTKSVLAIPLVNGKKQIVGVLQLINSKKNGEVVAFKDTMVLEILKFGEMVTIPLEKALLTEDMIMRMLHTSALRDPKETAGHVWRVGCMAAELYQKWAESHNIEVETMLSIKSQLRLAAMLHDIGKVAIPDAILKKPGRLDDDERNIMQEHAYQGASLFKNSRNEIDKMAYDITLHHHAKWDGSGYTGNDTIKSPKGEEIPIFARITSIVDVYDALVSRRIYKEAWDESEAINILKKDAGTHFDPELVDEFIKIQPLIQAIFERYKG